MCQPNLTFHVLCWELHASKRTLLELYWENQRLIQSVRNRAEKNTRNLPIALLKVFTGGFRGYSLTIFFLLLKNLLYKKVISHRNHYIQHLENWKQIYTWNMEWDYFYCTYRSMSVAQFLFDALLLILWAQTRSQICDSDYVYCFY